MALKTVVIVGTGWAGLTLARKLDEKKFKIVIISPESTSPYTPLLASAACGLFDFSVAEEPVRRKSQNLRYIKAIVDNIDFVRKICFCSPAFEAISEQKFEVSYDCVVIAPGCTSQTFGTPGVQEHALFVKNVRDAMAVRQRMSDLLEMASLPNKTEQERKDMLHIIVVGGGPTGIEISAELYDLIHNDFSILYPHLANSMSIAVHDVASRILSAFDASLSEYALASLSRREVSIKTGSHITKVEKDCLYTKEDGRIPYGMLIWATGNKQVPLVDTLPVLKSDRLPRILTDSRLRIFAPDALSLIGSAYALGDAADVRGGELPTTAEVACQKAEYLARVLNSEFLVPEPFAYSQRALVTYIGHHDGVIGGRKDWSGPRAWIAWRSKNLLWTRSWKTRILIGVNWVLNWAFGKEVARN
ncbi:NADH:quinone reductase (non-electrogenic), partial [Lecanoromycetidae sp. Uapishka_2]